MLWDFFKIQIQIAILNQIGTVYHNAYTQTGPIKEQIKFSGLVTRDTQTSGLEVNVLKTKPWFEIKNDEENLLPFQTDAIKWHFREFERTKAWWNVRAGES